MRCSIEVRFITQTYTFHQMLKSHQNNSMRTNKINIFVVGTRAQLIKVAPVICDFEKNCIPIVLLMTGQHKETMNDLISEFPIKTEPIYALKADERSSIFSLLSWLPKAYISTKRKFDSIKKEYNSDANVFVHGDTLTTLVSAYAGKQAACRIIHLESGLTSGNLWSPFPEEIIRRLVFKVTDMAFCPDERSVKHMTAISNAQVLNTNGNTIFDALELVAKNNHNLQKEESYVVASIHRFDNIYNQDRLRSIVNMLIGISEIVGIKFVLHPATIKRLTKYNLYEKLQARNNIHLINRMGYSGFIRTTMNAECVLTDGGSNQEELAYLGIPTIIMRKCTERSDGLGSNAIMEDEIENLVEFIKQKKYEALKKEKKNVAPPTPSQRITEVFC